MVTIKREVPVDSSKQEQSESGPPSQFPTPLRAQGHQFQDYQIELRTLEQENKNRLMMAKHEMELADIDDKIAFTMSSLPTNYSPEHAALLLEQNNVKQLLLEKHAKEMEGLRVDTAHRKPTVLSEFQASLDQMQLERQKKQQIILGQQATVMMKDGMLRQREREVADFIERGPPLIQPALSNHALQDYQMQMMLLEQQNRKRAKAEQQPSKVTEIAIKLESCPPMPAPQSHNHALYDYQIHLMLLEQQNKKRIIMKPQIKEATVKDIQEIQAEQTARIAKGLGACREKTKAIAKLKMEMVMVEQEDMIRRTGDPSGLAKGPEEVYYAQLAEIEKQNEKDVVTAMEGMAERLTISSRYRSCDD